MSKINKIFPSFFNGVSQQSPELMLDSQCRDMENCVPDLVTGLKKRPPLLFKTNKDFVTYPMMQDSSVFHVYDRGEDEEEYLFVQTTDADHPVIAFNIEGEGMNIEYNPDTEAEVKSYLAQGNLKGLTVQDRTWVFSKNAKVGLTYDDTYALNPNYTRTAYYWLKRGSGDRYNPFNYAVYLNGITYSVNPNKPSSSVTDPATGAEDSNVAAQLLADKINGVTTNYQESVTSLSAQETKEVTVYVGKSIELADISYEIIIPEDSVQGSFINNYEVPVNSFVYNQSTGYITYEIQNSSYLIDTSLLANGNDAVVEYIPAEATVRIFFRSSVTFRAECEGSILKIYREDGGDFDFSSWDSWGNQASEGWKGSVNKITDLPKEMPYINTQVKITGNETNTFTDYFVDWNGSSWVECPDPEINRGRLTNMPVKLDRTSLVNGVATFTFDLIDWSKPRVGNIDNNPNPSFAPEHGETEGRSLQDIFFYKNRLGIASEDSISLSESANYTNFYTSTAVDIIDTDIIDITIATNQASKIYYAKPFNNTLYIFTKYAQYELVAEGIFSPQTVSLNNASNYPMAVNVEPIVVNDSLYFISTTNNRQQLREYIKTDRLSIKGVDLNTSTPTYIDEPVIKLVADGVLGYVLCCTSGNHIYLYNFKEDGEKRVQSAWSRWSILNGLEAQNFEYHQLESRLLVMCKTDTDYRYHSLQLDYNIPDNNVDTSLGANNIDATYPYESKVVLQDYYPQLTNVRTPKNKLLIKKITIEGEGNFDAEIYRKDYDRTYTKSHINSMKDLDLHVASKIGTAEITIKDSTKEDFNLTSIIVEGLFNATSREMR